MEVQLSPESKKDIDIRYHAFVDGIILSRCRIVFPLALVMHLAFLLIDKYTYPAQASEFLKIRLIDSFICIVLIFMLYTQAATRYARWLLDLGASTYILGVAFMIFLSDGSGSRYYEGENLVFIGYAMINSFYVYRTIVLSLLWLGCYELAIFANHSPFNLINFLFANYFMGSTALFSVLICKFYRQQHYRAFLRQEQLKLTADELERSNRDLEQFAYVASHDLQEPLRMVASFCQKLEKGYKDKLDAAANEYIHFAVDGATRMQAIIQGLLKYARAGKKGVDLTRVDLNKILATILHDLDAVIKQNDATVQVGPLPVVMANEVQMTQLFLNFLTNALKFKAPDRKPVVEVAARKAGNVWEFKVRDNGIGIDQQHFSKLFVLFQRFHERGAYPGSGIGLASCKKIIENYQGTVRVESKLGEGTAFFFTLNLKDVL